MNPIKRITSHIRRIKSSWRYPVDKKIVTQVRVGNNDLLVLANEAVGQEIVSIGSYEASDVNFLLSQIRAADICMDIGANVGYYTLQMSSKAALGHVHSFEPVPLNFHLLSASVELNQSKNVTLNQCALGATVGETAFSESSDGAFSSIRATDRRPEVHERIVRMDTIDAYLKRNGICRVDVVKIDVEGAEKLVLDGAALMFGAPSSRPRLVLVELFDQNLAPYGSSVEDVTLCLERFGYVGHYVDEHARLKKMTASTPVSVCNVIFLLAGNS